MARLRILWDRMLGRVPAAGVADRAAPRAAKADRSAPGSKGQLELVRDAPRKRPPQRVGEAGFDPYGNDGGYSKPQGWERVNRD